MNNKQQIISPSRDNLSNPVTQLREAIGIGIREMGREMGISASTICYWEKGTREPNILMCHKLIKFAKAYGVNIDVEWLRPLE